MVAVLFGIKISQERFGSLKISSCVPAVASGRAERVSLQRYIYLRMTAARHKHIIKAIADKAKAIVPKGSEIILFGSRARGDARDDSDWDILVLLNKKEVLPDDIDDVAYPLRELGWDFGETINTILYTKEEWNRDIASPFYENVTREGIRL